MKYFGRYKKGAGIWGEWREFTSLDEARTTCEFLAKAGAISGDKQIEICTEDEYKKKMAADKQNDKKNKDI